MSKSLLETRISDEHYAIHPEYERTSKKFMRGMIPDAPKLRILDVGCGTGVNATFLRAAGHDVTGIDLSPVAIEQYRAKGLEGLVCDLEAGPAPFPDGAFDLVYVSEIIEHVAHTAAFLQELFRLTRPGGKMLLSTPNSAFWPYRILGVLGQTPTEYQHPGHVRFFSKRSLAAAIAEAGFEVETVAARHMYMILGKGIADPLAPVLERVGFMKEPRFATNSHFWQVSRFSPRASGVWADTLIVEAKKKRAA